MVYGARKIMLVTRTADGEEVENVENLNGLHSDGLVWIVTFERTLEAIQRTMAHEFDHYFHLLNPAYHGLSSLHPDDQSAFLGWYESKYGALKSFQTKPPKYHPRYMGYIGEFYYDMGGM
jgi:hypothetical protein